jgi:environmental stress-induced protein Ves
MRTQRFADHKAMPWANGLGTSYEILKREWPGNEQHPWLYRIAMAPVKTDGPFSSLPGVDRQLCVLKGAGFQLTIDGHIESALNGAVVRFRGDSDTSAELIEGESWDLGLMVRRGAGPPDSFDVESARMWHVTENAAACLENIDVVVAAGEGVVLFTNGGGEEVVLNLFDAHFPEAGSCIKILAGSAVVITGLGLKSTSNRSSSAAPPFYSRPLPPLPAFTEEQLAKLRLDYDQSQRAKLKRASLPQLSCDDDEGKIRELTPFLHDSSAYDTVRSIFETEKSMLDHFGENSVVPVKHTVYCELDEAGRAPEPVCVPASLKTWFDEYLGDESSRYYLKDYHFVPHLPVITPELFRGMDILGPFLRTYDLGDYDFLYHGPAGSTTPRHSDVLFSHSFSYNVKGVKRWRFHGEEDEVWEADQNEGEVMFVPSGLEHDVCNSSEAISINRNWITCPLLSRLWATVEQESKSVEEEIAKWDMTLDCKEREEMLRGACGMNKGMFFVMVLMAGQERYERVLGGTRSREGEYGGGDGAGVDFFLCAQALKEVMEGEGGVGEEIAAFLGQGADAAADAIERARQLVEVIESLTT